MAYALYHDEDMIEVVADRDGLVQVAVAFVQTAAQASSEPGHVRSGFEMIPAFRHGSGLKLWGPTYHPEPEVPGNAEMDWKSRTELWAIQGGCLLFVLLAVVGLVTVVGWVL